MSSATEDVAKGMQVLRAGELVLEPLVVAHADAMFAVLREPALYRYLDAPAPPSVDHLRCVYARQQRRRSPDGTQTWLNWVVRPGGADPIGFVQATITPARTAWVGFVFSSAHWGHGYAFAAMQAMLAQLDSAYSVTSCFATCDPFACWSGSAFTPTRALTWSATSSPRTICCFRGAAMNRARQPARSSRVVKDLAQ
jgi:RimJ/RimL family protein N-acetyltransferase